MADGRRLDGIRLRPAAVTVPLERRDDGTLSLRICSEFQEMPGGTCLTIAQASRLFGVPSDVGIRVLRRLVDEGVLRVTPDGRYRLRSTAA
jgi:DNA-binding IclR family transcriptional regulator